MCKVCKNIDGELGEYLVSKFVGKNILPMMLTGWVWNKDRKGKLWFTVDVGDHTVIETKIPIKYCPLCGRNLEV